MFKPQIQKTRVLITLAIISLLMLYISSHSIVIELAAGYEDKIKSAKIMEKALQVLRKEVKQRGFIIYEDADPNYTGLIFNDPVYFFYCKYFINFYTFQITAEVIRLIVFCR